MIKYIMRKIIYKGIAPKTQDALIKLLKPYWTLYFICYQFLTIYIMLPIIPMLIISFFGGKNLEVSNLADILITAFLIIHIIASAVFAQVFKDAYQNFIFSLWKKSYFLLCTKKGKAISKNDFKTIKEVNSKQFEYIETQKCSGLCYGTCFEILKALKKGRMEFISAKSLQCSKEQTNEGKYFTAHVLYINNGWAFDTFSVRQYKVEDLYAIYEAKVYKSFDYEAIKDKSYDEFKKDELLDFEKWCAENDCTVYFRGD